MNTSKDKYKANVTYPTTISNLLNTICNNMGIELATSNFTNSNYIIYGNPFTNNETNSTVISSICQLAGGFAYIGRDDKLYIKNLELNNKVETIDSSVYLDDFEMEEYYLARNTVTIALPNVEGENVSKFDDPSKPIKEITIKENYLLTSDEDRKKVINNLFETLNGFNYLPFSVSHYGFPYLDIGDNIWICDMKGNKYNSYIFNFSFKYNGAFSGKFETPLIDETIEKIKNSTDLKTRFRNVELSVDKINGKIKSLIEENTGYENKISELEQTVDSITDKVFNEIDITREQLGLKKIILENCMSGYLLELHIYGNNTVFDYLLPSNNLLPSDNLLPYGDSRLKVTRQVKDEKGNITEVSEIIDLGIKKVLRQKEEVCDEYVLLNNKAKIIRRIGVLETGETYILPNEQIEDLGEFIIELYEGTNTIEIKNYTANVKARCVILNNFTKKFATSVQVESIIKQTTREILIELRQKVGTDEIFARINMAVLGIDDVEIPEDIEKSFIEILANKIAIKSDNFELTKNGVIKALAGIIAGLNMTTNNNGDSYLYKNYKVGDKTYQSGLFIPKEGNGSSVFLYAGLDITNDLNYLSNANMIIRHDGLVKAKWFEVNGESGSFFVKYNNGNIAMSFTKDNIKRFLENGNTWVIEGIGYINNVPNSHTTWLYDAQSWGINGGEQHNNEGLFRVYRRGNNNEAPVSYFWTNLFVNGSQIGSSVSDKRLKKNIKDCKKSALEKIRQFKIKSFKWRKGKNPYEDAEESVDFGIIAQEAEEVDKNSIIHNKKHDSWQMNDLNLICTNIKAIQELDEENQILKEQVRTQQKIMDFLINKLDCQNELKEYMKGEKA